MLFDGWDELGRVLVMGVLGYAGLIVILRITGKRTLAKMNAFDLVVTVSLGSVLAAAVLDENVSLAEAIAADDELPSARVALTWGRVLSRLGDIYGPTVNLASRLTSLADPGTVLVDALTAAAEAGDDDYNPVATPEYIAKAHDAGLRVIPWTVNDEATMREQIEAGVDGIITDYPTMLKTILDEQSVDYSR